MFKNSIYILSLLLVSHFSFSIDAILYCDSELEDWANYDLENYEPGDDAPEGYIMSSYNTKLRCHLSRGEIEKGKQYIEKATNAGSILSLFIEARGIETSWTFTTIRKWFEKAPTIKESIKAYKNVLRNIDIRRVYPDNPYTRDSEHFYNLKPRSAAKVAIFSFGKYALTLIDHDSLVRHLIEPDNENLVFYPHLRVGGLVSDTSTISSLHELRQALDYCKNITYNSYIWDRKEFDYFISSCLFIDTKYDELYDLENQRWQLAQQIDKYNQDKAAQQVNSEICIDYYCPKYQDLTNKLFALLSSINEEI